MKLDEKSKTLLIENPFCGNSALTKGLRLEDSGASKWAYPKDARGHLGEDKWRAFTKFVLVREPTLRFLSGATWSTIVDRNIHLEWGATDGYVEFIADLIVKDIPNVERTRVLLEYLISSEFKDIPKWFFPQKLWLSAKFDIVIATHNIAEYFNNTFTDRSVKRGNLIASDPGRDKLFLVTPQISHLVRQLYTDDFDLFEKLLVWCPSKEKVRLITGYCTTCEKGIKDKSFIPVNLQDYDEGEVTSVKPKSKRKVKKSSTKSD